MWLTQSCVDEIQLPIRQSTTDVNISCVLSDSLETQKVLIQYTAAIGKDAAVDGAPISGAEVAVTTKQGLKIPMTENSKTKGSYESVFRVAQGHDYRIEVNMPSGKKYLSDYKSVSPIKTSVEVLARSFKEQILTSANNIITQDKVGVYFNSSLRKDGFDLKALYRISGEYQVQEFYLMILNPRTCYVKENLDFNNLAAYDGKDYVNGQLKEVKLFSTLGDYRFYDTYAFLVEQYIVDDATYQYFNSVYKLTNIDNNLFAVPPGRIKGNIYNPDDPNEDVSGYFTVGAKTSKRIFTDQGTLGLQVYSLCQNPNKTIRRYQDMPTCYDCLLITGAQREKPSYWR